MPITAARLMKQSPSSESQEVDEILEDLDDEIRAFAGRKTPRRVVPPEIFDLEVDEIAQNIRIKLWLALQRGQIFNLRAYISRIARTESVDMVRRNKKTLSLLTSEYNDLHQEEMTAVPLSGMQDPADEYEQKEVAADYAEKIVKGVLSLPPRQQYALLCDLKDHAANIQPLVDAFLKCGLDLEGVSWSGDEDEQHRLRVSCSIARKKLRSNLKLEGVI